MIKKTSPILALLLFATTFSGYSMEKPNDYKKLAWVALAGAAIIGGAIALNQFLSYIHSEPTESFNFLDLPFDKQYLIITLLTKKNEASSLEAAAEAINSLAQTNKELNELINDPEFCLTLIKKLAQQFNCSDERAAKTLQTKEAKQRVKLQRQLYNMCYSPKPSKDDFESLYKQGVDLEFGNFWQTDDTDWASPLMLAAQNGNNTMIQYLLEKDININQSNSYGTTALMVAKTNPVIQLLCSIPTLNINQQDIDGNTALMRKLKSFEPYHLLPLPMQIFLGNPELVIKAMLNAGADPELANFAGLTPLQAAQATNNQELIDLIQDAINKKHEGQTKGSL